LRDLYDELRASRGFSLAADALKVAVNAEFSAWDRPLRDGDTIVFIPPVAGG
jgi:molybdopterin converting factor small subunit